MFGFVTTFSTCEFPQIQSVSNESLVNVPHVVAQDFLLNYEILIRIPQAQIFMGDRGRVCFRVTNFVKTPCHMVETLR
jgi:hypothetical protein